MNASNKNIIPFPSPSEKEDLKRPIEELRQKLANPPEGFDKNKGKVKLADLLVGRNEPGDYIEASKIYEEIIDSSPPGETHAEAVIGKAELLVQSEESEDIESGIKIIQGSISELEGLNDSYFEIKAKLVNAELLLRRGSEKDNGEALKIYDEILEEPNILNYFRMRAIVGKIDIMEYFKPERLKEELEELIIKTEKILDANKERQSDYFRLKGNILLAELYIHRDSKEDVANAKKMLSDVANNEAAGIDLIARASLDLAEVSSEAVAKMLLRQVRHMQGIDPYVFKKAQVLEDKISPKGRKKKRT